MALSVYSMGIFVGSGLAFAIGGLVVQAVSATPTMSLPLIDVLCDCRLCVFF